MYIVYILLYIKLNKIKMTDKGVEQEITVDFEKAIQNLTDIMIDK